MEKEIALLGQSIKAMAGSQCLLGWSPDTQLALDPKPASGQERRKVSHGGPAALGGLPACDSLRDLHLHLTGMSVCTVRCWLHSRVMTALPNGVYPISGRYGVEECGELFLGIFSSLLLWALSLSSFTLSSTAESPWFVFFFQKPPPE